MKPCRACAEMIQDAAIKCRFCGESQVPQPAAQAPTATAPNTQGMLLAWPPANPGHAKTQCPSCGAPVTLAPTREMAKARRGGPVGVNCLKCRQRVTFAFQDPPPGMYVPVPMSQGMLLGLIFGPIALVFIVIVATVSSSKPSSTATTASAPSTTYTAPVVKKPAELPTIQIDNVDLWRDYDANEVAADQQYRGRWLLVTGYVGSIDKDFLDHIVVRLKSPNQFMNTSAQMKPSMARDAAALRKGQTVSLLCRCKGKVIGSPMLEDCTLQ